MPREEDKHRSPEYVPDGPVRIAVDHVRYRDTLKEIAAIEPCPCPCCGDHDAVMLARRALAAT